MLLPRILRAPEGEPSSGGAPEPKPEDKKPEEKKPEPEPKLERAPTPSKREVPPMSESTGHALLDELRIFNGRKKTEVAPGPEVPGAPESSPVVKQEPEKKKRRSMGWFEFDE